MNENEEKQNRSVTDKNHLTPNEIFFLAIKLVAFGIILYVSLNHVKEIFILIGKFFGMISPLLLGGLVALILNTPMMAIEKLYKQITDKTKLKYNKRTCEIVSLILTFLIAVLLIYVMANSIFPQLVESLKSIYQKAQTNIPNFLNWLENLEQYGINTDPITNWLNEIDINALIGKITENVMSIINTIASSASSIISGASSIISGAFTAVTSVVFAVYILSNKRKLCRQLKQIGYAYLKKPLVDRTREICSLAVKTFSNFISGQCLEAIILGLMFFISMSIFRMPYALAISSLIAITAIIPYIGAFLGCAFGMLLMVIDDPLSSLWFLIMFLVIQQIETQFIYPRVVGGSVGLPAIWTFAAVVIGGALCGILGMILFIPLFSVLYTLLRENVHKRLNKRGIVIEYESDSDAPKTVKKHDFSNKLFNQLKDKLSSIKKPPKNDGEE